MKIFAITDCEWWAGETLEESVADYSKQTGISPEDSSFGEPYELTDEEMDSMVFTDDDGQKRSFRDQLLAMEASGVKFPTFFAMTEY